MRWIYDCFGNFNCRICCLQRHRNRQAPPEIEHKDEAPQVFMGLASYYSDQILKVIQLHRENTYDPTRMTAAHRTLPFGTRLLGYKS